jgi:hypothetical protein
LVVLWGRADLRGVTSVCDYGDAEYRPLNKANRWTDLAAYTYLPIKSLELDLYRHSRLLLGDGATLL